MAADCLLVWDQRWLLALQHVRVCTEQQSRHVCLSIKRDTGEGTWDNCFAQYFITSALTHCASPDQMHYEAS